MTGDLMPRDFSVILLAVGSNVQQTVRVKATTAREAKDKAVSETPGRWLALYATEAW